MFFSFGQHRSGGGGLDVIQVVGVLQFLDCSLLAQKVLVLAVSHGHLHEVRQRSQNVHAVLRVESSCEPRCPQFVATGDNVVVHVH